MAEFMKAQRFVLQAEGGYVFDPNDAGGETYRGISRHNFPQWVGWEEVDKAKPKTGEIIQSQFLDNAVNAFYQTNFWDNIKADQIDSQKVATYGYDWYVNAGRNAIKEIQKVLGIADDGIIGPGTLGAINTSGEGLLILIHNARIEYYQRIATGHNARFLKGWLNRCNYLYSQLQ